MKFRSDNFAKLMERVRMAAGLSPSVWRKWLGVTSARYEGFLSGKEEIPVQIASGVCEAFGAALGNLATGSLDESVFLARAMGKTGLVPQRYKEAAFSKTRSAILLLDWIQDNLGPYPVRELMFQYQLDAMSFEDPEVPINIRFFSDATDFLVQRFGVDPRDFFYVGALFERNIRRSPLGDVCKKLRDVSSIYEHLTGDLQDSVELNCEYGLERRRRGRYVMTSVPREKVMDLLHMHSIGNENICHWRRGLLSSLPQLLGNPSAEVAEDRCIHSGDPYCRFQIETR